MKNIFTILFTSLLSVELYAQCLVFPPYGHSYGIRKATQAHLFLFLPFHRFEDPQGLATAKMVARDDPSTIKDDDEVVVYGVNSGKHQLIYNTSMWGLASYGKEGSGIDQFKYPKGIACDPQGNVYVVDAGNNRIVHLFNPDRNVEWVKAFSGNENGKKGLLAPSQIGLDAVGRLYVTDTGNRRVVVFDSTGRIRATMGKNEECDFADGPTTIAVADGAFRWSYFRNERFFFCADRGGTRLWKITLTGKVEKTVVMPKGYHAFYGAVDYYHNLYVTDKEKHCVLKFDHSLKLLDIFGSFGKEDNQFIEPRGITIWKRYGQIFVAEKTGAQYFWVGTGIRKLGLWKGSADEKPSQLFCKTDLTEYSFVSLLGVSGSDTVTLLKPRFIRPGKNVFSFINQNTKPVSNYVCRIEPTYSSYTYYQWEYPVKLCSDSTSVPKAMSQGVLIKKKGEKVDDENNPNTELLKKVRRIK